MEWPGKLKYKTYQKMKRMIRKMDPPGAAILMYHRIGDRNKDPWEMFVSEANFKQHLRILQKFYDVHVLANLHDIPLRKQYRKKIFITFDDGCLDNYETALPLLETFGFPATFFIPTAILKGQTIFWWEILDYVFWNKEGLSSQINLVVGKDKFTRDVPKRDTFAEGVWSANREPAPSAYCQLYMDVCEWIRVRPPAEQAAITAQLIAVAEDQTANGNFFEKMSAEQIAFLSKNGYEIGAHSIHHPALKYHDPKLQQEEISMSKTKLEAIIEKPVVSFAYPHGEYNEDTITVMKNCRFKYGCTTDWGAIHPGSDKLILPRMLVRNTKGDFFEKQLNYLFNS